MPKVSVIIPMYGVEKFIERCARSLFEQTLDDIEYIFVNDCTKDNTVSVLQRVIEEYPNRQHQIQVIHHEQNKGISHARETGVKEATGEYIAHCDSDDWIDTSAYETLYNFAVSNGYDFVKAEHYISDGNNTKTYKVFGSDNVTKDLSISYLLACKGWNSIWDTLSKRDLYFQDDVKFTDDPMLEDFFLVVQLLIKSDKIGVLRQPFYYYFQNPDSICHVPSEEAVIRRCGQAYRNIHFILQCIHRAYGNKFKKEEAALMFIPRHLMVPIMTNKKNYQYWDEIYDGKVFDVLFNPYIIRVYKQRYYLVVFRLYSLYRKLFRKNQCQ